jgi:GNAT superfamily N-acetyltransferase
MLPALCRADNNGPVIRPAVPADADKVAGLAAALAQSFPFSPAAFAASFPVLVAAPDVCLLVADGGAELGGYLLGFRHLTFFANGPVGWVEEILVAESSRGTGTGRALMTAFERRRAAARWRRWRPAGPRRSTVPWATRRPPPTSASGSPG